MNESGAITVYDPLSDTSLTFKDLAELETWVEAERRAWAPLEKLLRSDDSFSFETIHRQLQMLKPNSKSEMGYSHTLNAISTGAYVTSNSPLGQKIRALLSTKTQFFGILLLAEANGVLDSAAKGVFGEAAETYKSQLDAMRSGSQAERDAAKGRMEAAAFTRIHDIWDEKIGAVYTRMEKATRDAKSASAEFRHHTEAQKVEFENLVVKSAQALNEQSAAHRIALEQVRKEFFENMRLRAVSSYWKEKEKIHDKGALVGLSLFVVLAGAAFAAILYWGPAYLFTLPNNSLAIAGATVPALLLFWMLRHVSRTFVSHFNQREDARQRRTLITTYLALIHKGAATDNERLLILHALFRPNATKDDDEPGVQSLLENLAKQAKMK